MTKGWAQALAISIGLNVFGATNLGMLYYKYRKANQQLEILQGLSYDKDAAVQESFQDCRRMMLMDGLIQRANGCLAGIENLCTRTNNVGICFDKLKDACGETDED